MIFVVEYLKAVARRLLSYVYFVTLPLRAERRRRRRKRRRRRRRCRRRKKRVRKRMNDR